MKISKSNFKVITLSKTEQKFLILLYKLYSLLKKCFYYLIGVIVIIATLWGAVN